MITVPRICRILTLALVAHPAAHASEDDAADKAVLTPTVLDAGGRIVGSLVPTLTSFGVYFRAGGHPVTVGLVPADGPDYKFTFSPAYFIAFPDVDCQGDALVYMDGDAIGPGFPSGVVARDQKLLLYVSDSLTSSLVDYKSYFRDGSCHAESSTNTFYRASAPPIDLAEKFSLPIRIR